ncbi:phage tail protein [Deinococcus soli (ex Cha et al. 2016)]|uniref:phage tail protein n=1 Tax=Deinococcus soli (ex Cha et al. 2016) TaxID=1309411 RepID=UPI00166C4A58|nr:tail fiber protein [Deinococcus soli (ex Cha et al. 2016)]GGB48599.1 tail Collar domain-containing protein [Deinococcus soli (ex Cha et al. 2016)]
MSEAYVGEIRIFAGNFAPYGWAFCNGQILPISQNTALFSLLGTTYGGNGTTTFALPNLQGRAPIHWGTGPGLTPRSLGESSGTAAVTLLSTQMPVHTHTLNAAIDPAESDNPANLALARGSNVTPYVPTPNATLSPSTLSIQGGSQPHNNMQPYLTMNFIIALQGIYPPRS